MQEDERDSKQLRAVDGDYPDYDYAGRLHGGGRTVGDLTRLSVGGTFTSQTRPLQAADAVR